MLEFDRISGPGDVVIGRLAQTSILECLTGVSHVLVHLTANVDPGRVRATLRMAFAARKFASSWCP